MRGNNAPGTFLNYREGDFSFQRWENILYSETFSLIEGRSYRLRVSDSFRDGLLSGYFAVYCGNQVVLREDNWREGRRRSYDFTVRNPNPQPTPSPTDQSTPLPTNPPTLSPVAPPTFLPTPGPTPSPNLPTPGYPVCSICDDGEVSSPVYMLQLPGQPARTCSEIAGGAQAGFVEPQYCNVLKGLAADCCDSPDETFPPCDICGEGNQVINPDLSLELPGQPPRTCAELIAFLLKHMFKLKTEGE